MPAESQVLQLVGQRSYYTLSFSKLKKKKMIINAAFLVLKAIIIYPGYLDMFVIN